MSLHAASPCDAQSMQARLNNGESPLTIYKSCEQQESNLYGLTYKGGLIAYLNTTDGSGFVAAAADYSNAAYWTNMNTSYYTPTYASATGLGSGQANTKKIVQALGVPVPRGGAYNYAAYLSAIPQSGYNDWYLPSQDEMVQILNNVIKKEACSQNGVLTNYGYWTSTEFNTDVKQAFYVDCFGSARRDMKNNGYGVRLARSFVDQTPVITSFSPTALLAGANLTITGTGFDPEAAKNTVDFTGNVSSVASQATTTSLVVAIPSGAQSGPFNIISDGNSSAASPPVTVQVMPTVTGFRPMTAQIGDALAVLGTNFSTTAANNTVYFSGGVSAVATQATATEIRTTIPVGAASGTVEVQSLGVKSSASPTPLTITVTMNFNGAPSHFNEFTQDGFQIIGTNAGVLCSQSQTGGTCLSSQTSAKYGTWLYFGGTNDGVIFQRSNGAAFSLKTIKLNSTNPQQVGGQLFTFTGTLATGGTVTHAVQTPTTSEAQTYTFPSNFTGLSSVSWPSKYYSMTDIVSE